MRACIRVHVCMCVLVCIHQSLPEGGAVHLLPADLAMCFFIPILILSSVVSCASFGAGVHPEGDVMMLLLKQKYSACHSYKVLRRPVISALVPGGKLQHTSTASAANIKPNMYHFDVLSVSPGQTFPYIISKGFHPSPEWRLLDIVEPGASPQFNNLRKSVNKTHSLGITVVSLPGARPGRAGLFVCGGTAK